MNLNDSPHAGRRLTEAELDNILHCRRVGSMQETWPRIPRVSSCKGPCTQGRLECPCPDACEKEDANPHARPTRIVLALCLLLTVAWTVVIVLFGAHAVEWMLK